MAVNLPSYIPLSIFDDLNAYACEEEDVSLIDHLAGIKVPILYLVTGRGSGSTGDYISSLTASSNLTYCLLTISGIYPASDYGHADF
jgi:hypothetical protein